MDIGPVDIIIMRFPGNHFRGEIVPALADLVERGTVRVIDLLFVFRDETGATGFLELGGLTKELGSEFGQLFGEVAGGVLDPEDAAVVAQELAPNSSAALLVLEHTWAIPFMQSLIRADGEVLSQARIPHADITAALDAVGS